MVLTLDHMIIHKATTLIDQNIYLLNIRSKRIIELQLRMKSEQCKDFFRFVTHCTDWEAVNVNIHNESA